MHYGNDQHWPGYSMGVLDWTLNLTAKYGQQLEVRGVDLHESAGGKIILQDSFWMILE